MTVTISDLIVPEVFRPYLSQQVTTKNRWIQSGVLSAPLALLAASDGADTVTIPMYNSDLTGDMEALSDSACLTPGDIGAQRMRGVFIHRGRAWAVRDLAAIVTGTDPMSEIANKLAAYILAEKSKDLNAYLSGVFGAVNSYAGNPFSAFTVNGTASAGGLTPQLVVQGRALLGDAGEKLTVLAMPSQVYYQLQQRQYVDYVVSGDSTLIPAASFAGGSYQGAFTNQQLIPNFAGCSIVVDDAIPVVGGVAAVYLFEPGSVYQGPEMSQQEADRDILCKTDLLSIDHHFIYHVKGATWAGTMMNPTRAQLATTTNWARVSNFPTKNAGVVRISITV